MRVHRTWSLFCSVSNKFFFFWRTIKKRARTKLLACHKHGNIGFWEDVRWVLVPFGLDCEMHDLGILLWFGWPVVAAVVHPCHTCLSIILYQSCVFFHFPFGLVWSMLFSGCWNTINTHIGTTHTHAHHLACMSCWKYQTEIIF